jgi:hypothetical protein
MSASWILTSAAIGLAPFAGAVVRQDHSKEPPQAFGLAQVLEQQFGRPALATRLTASLPGPCFERRAFLASE